MYIVEKEKASAYSFLQEVAYIPLPDHLKQGCQTYFTWWAIYSPEISIVVGEKRTFCHFVVLILTLIINYFVVVYWPWDRSKDQGLCQIEVILAPRPYI